jgi:hypothetical protein
VESWLIVLLVIAGLVIVFAVAQHFGWIDLSNKRKSSGNAGVMGIGDEVFHPTRHEAQLEMDRQTVLPAPAPLPGDGDKGIYEGQVRIDLARIDAAPGRERASE